MRIEEGFKFSDFKSFVLTKIKENLSSYGYKLIESKLCFRKDTSLAKIEIGLDFINYQPDEFQYNLAAIVWVEPLHKIMKRFYQVTNINAIPKWNTAFFEGDFIDELKNRESKFRQGYYNEVRSIKEAEDSIKQSLTILKDLMLPLAHSVSTVEGFRKYYLGNKNEIVANFSRSDLFISCLLAAYLESKDCYYSLAEYCKIKLDEDEKNTGMPFTKLYDYLSKLNQFVEQDG